MARKIEITRTFNLGQYKNIKVTESVDIPDNYTFDTDFLNLIRRLLLNNINLTYFIYVTEGLDAFDSPREKALELLLEEQKKLTESILKYDVEKGE